MFSVAPLIPPSSLAPFVAVEKVIGLLSIIFAEYPHIGASFCRFKAMPTVCPGSPVVGDSVNVIAALALVAIIIISNSVVLFISFLGDYWKLVFKCFGAISEKLRRGLID